ncbi:MAG: 3-dehydroquinate synthase [Chlamydiae bacterium]|nr:3-dehydroquinate synthase [Chlamydiota bacterium]
MYAKILETLSFQRGAIVIVTDTNVARLYTETFFEELKKIKANIFLVKIPPKESSKSRFIKESIEDQLINLGVSRNDTIVAFGGGVVSDVVGYVAATYLRGVSYMVVPTTLMGMVDAAIGGKNGINHEKGKNLMGSLLAPDDVFIEPSFLKTLSYDVYLEGFMEVIKYGLIADESFFDSIYEKSLSIHECIERSIEIKKSIVKQDPKDIGLRRILNFGHLVAHAIEKCTAYVVSHGRALWYGMLIESYLSYLKGYLSLEGVKKIVDLLLREENRFALIDEIEPEALYNAMKVDKKAKESVPRAVLLKRIGKVVSFGGEYCTPISYNEFVSAFSWVNNLIANPLDIRSFTA